MTPERWQAVDDLLQAALERAPAERAAFLDQACAPDGELDAELRREVESLLRFQPQADDFLAAPPTELAADLVVAKPDATLPPREVGSYEVLRELGRGGMGAVYLARDARLGRQVALKLLPPAAVANHEQLRRFRQEARAVSALNHPNILTLFELGEAADNHGSQTHFIATEYVEGQTLRNLITRGGLSLGEALDVASQTAGALAAAHQTGIVHRDIKPENLMLRPDGLVKVLDFGIAKLAHRKTAANTSFSTINTNPGLIMGTVSYMSPEQARGLEVDARSDIFSLGVVLYEMLTAHTPFSGATTSDVLASILEHEPPPLKQYAPALPAELQRIVNRAMAKDRDQRYQQASELFSELKELKQELELAARLKRSGDTPARQVSLSLRVGQTALEAAANTDDAPTSAINSVIKPAFLRRFARPLPLAAMALLVLLALAWAIYRYAPTTSRAEIQALAVLPFVNATGDTEIEYLPDGITESLMQSLQQMPGLRVMARGTIYTYKGRVVDPRQVGQELKVQAVITGRVQRQGNRLLVSAELAETRDGTQLWSEQYQRPLDDLSALQDQLAREIALKLRPQLAHTSTPPTSTTPAIKSEAYQLYLKGRYFQRQATQASGEKALDLFNQAIRLEPKFALPHSGIALVYQNLASQSVPPREARERARQAALTALALDNRLAEAHYAMATIKVLDWDWAGTEQAYKQALALNPAYIDARYSYGGLLARFHRNAEAQVELERTLEIDPLSQQTNIGLGNIYFYSHQYGRAREQFRKAIELDPKSSWASGAHRILAMILIEEKRYAEALEELRMAFEINPSEPVKAWLAYGFARAGKAPEARALLRELQAAARDHWVSPVYFARIHIGLGEYDQAIARLRESYAAQSDHLIHLSVEPVYDPLRNDPRFIEILRGVGLPQ